MARAKRWAVTATNHETGEVWSIHDSRKVCEDQLSRKLKEWGAPDAPVEWAELDTTGDGIDDEQPVSGVAQEHGTRGISEDMPEQVA